MTRKLLFKVTVNFSAHNVNVTDIYLLYVTDFIYESEKMNSYDELGTILFHCSHIVAMTISLDDYLP